MTAVEERTATQSMHPVVRRRLVLSVLRWIGITLLVALNLGVVATMVLLGHDLP